MKRLISATAAGAAAAALMLAAALPAAASTEHVVNQKGKAFDRKELTVKAGEKVVFRNDDPFSHNVFSLSKPTPFDLGTFGKGQSRDIVFAKEGTFEIECAVHPEMQMTVKVVK